MVLEKRSRLKGMMQRAAGRERAEGREMQQGESRGCTQPAQPLSLWVVVTRDREPRPVRHTEGGVGKRQRQGEEIKRDAMGMGERQQEGEGKVGNELK